MALKLVLRLVRAALHNQVCSEDFSPSKIQDLYS